MQTKTILPSEMNLATEIIHSGGIIAFPTETVYGLGADCFNEEAVKKIFEAKGRPQDNPLIIHISSVKDFNLLTDQVDTRTKKIIEKFFPGPLTLIVKKSNRIPNVVTAGLDTVAIRMPSHPLAQEFLKKVKTPIAAPSANISGRPSTTSFKEVLNDLDGRIEGIIKGESSPIGIESTVLNLTSNPPQILRPGDITLSQIREIIPEAEFSPSILSTKNPKHPASPGMKYTHYKPDANVYLVNGNLSRFKGDKKALVYTRTRDNAGFSLGENRKEWQKNLYPLLRDLDKKGFKEIYIENFKPDETTIGVYDRLLHASGYQILSED